MRIMGIMMTSFQDNTGRLHTVNITVAAAKRVRAALGVDLMDALYGNLAVRFAMDPVLLVDVLYVALQPEGMSDVQFGEAMAGDAIEHGANALMKSLISFCRRPSERKTLGRIWEQTSELLDSDRVPAPTSGDSSTNAPGSSASILDPSPSAS
jgi:hypothetical protein